MTEQLHDELRVGIENEVRDRFRKAADDPRGHFTYPTGRAGLLALGYAAEMLGALPEAVQHFYCGVGNPFEAGLPAAREQVLDVGCGAGVDALLAARQVGLQGRVTGLEFSPAMRERARLNAAAVGTGNVSFLLGSAEALPFADASFDVLLSNGVYNLVLRKKLALAEACRVLRPGGRLLVADQILEDDAPLELSPPSALDWAG